MMNRYKQEVDAIHAPDTLKTALQTMQTEKAPAKPKPFKKWIAAAAAVLVVLLVGVTCVPAFSKAGSAPKKSFQMADSASFEGLSDSYDSEAAESYYKADSSAAMNAKTPAAALPAGRKLIRDASLIVETRDFDQFHAALQAKLTALQGYTESSDINTRSDNTRYASIVLRVPAESLDTFLQDVSALCTVTQQSTTVQDVTDTYIDTESRITAVETEQTALLEILKKAEELSDILEIQNRLTEVRADLESYKGQLKTLDSNINYSKVTLDISEVERVTSPESQSFFGEVRRNLSDNLYSIGHSARTFAIWFLSSLPYFVILAVLAVAAILIVRRVRKRRKK